MHGTHYLGSTGPDLFYLLNEWVLLMLPMFEGELFGVKIRMLILNTSFFCITYESAQ
jgi:hypothetical protein